MMILARMMHVLEKAITKAKFVSNRISTEQQILISSRINAYTLEVNILRW